MRQYAGASASHLEDLDGVAPLRLALIETSGSIRTRSDPFVGADVEDRPSSRSRARRNGTIIAVPTAAAATRRAPRLAVAESRARAPGPVQTGPQPWTRRSASAKTIASAAARNDDSVERLDELLQHRVGERDHRDGRQQRQQRAAAPGTRAREQEKIAAHIADDRREQQRLRAVATARPGSAPARRPGARRRARAAACRGSAGRARSCPGRPRARSRRRVPPRDTQRREQEVPPLERRTRPAPEASATAISRHVAP